MYTLEQLQQKTFGELKAIGWELNVLPEGDRRCRQTWIDAIAGVNPPLLQLLEVSPAASVEQVQAPIIETVETSPGVEVEPVQEAPLESKFDRIVYPRPVQEAIEQVPENSPAVEVDRALSHKFLLCLKEGHNTLWYDGKNFVSEKWSAKTYCKRGVGSAKHQLRCHPDVKRLGNLQVVENSPADQKLIEVQAQEPIALAAKTSPGVEVDRVQGALKADITEFNNRFRGTSAGFYKPRSYATESVDEFEPECAECFDDGFVEEVSGFIKICHCRSASKLSPQSVQSAITPATKNLPGSRSKASTAHQLLELFKSSAHILEDSPGVKTEATVSESAIEPATKHHLEEESDPNPILTGIPLSDRFVARYSPPQPENILFKSEPDGQLSLLDFEVQSQPEPPDPDDYESLDAFREAIARWDWEHPSSFDHCSDLPSSQDNDVSSQDEPLEISLDSFCEWAPCPLDWYEPADLLEPSEVSELSAVAKSSITSEFFIPTFGRWGDRSDRNDEPPDTGIFARLPKPKPPKFPPQAASQLGIPKVFHRVVAGSISPARSPPGGDA